MGNSPVHIIILYYIYRNQFMSVIIIILSSTYIFANCRNDWICSLSAVCAEDLFHCEN